MWNTVMNINFQPEQPEHEVRYGYGGGGFSAKLSVKLYIW